MSALLTITIPTFNRGEHLDVLLESLFVQINAFKDEVRIAVIDNHSTDDTALRCEAWKKKGMPFEYICNATNIGMAGNIIKCFEITDTEYSWTIGDDDVLRKGALRLILETLKRCKPDILQIGIASISENPIASQMEIHEKVTPRVMDASSFFKLTHVWLTFISGNLIRKATHANAANTAPLTTFENTVIPQLGWILETLKSGNRFVFVPQRLLLARRRNSGGYNPFKTFSVDIVAIVDTHLPPAESATFKVRAILKFVAPMIMSYRRDDLGDFQMMASDPADIRQAFSKFLGYWIWIVPLMRFPMGLAVIVYQVSRLFSKSISVVDRIEIYGFKLKR